jgi:hypothetical protein
MWKWELLVDIHKRFQLLKLWRRTPINVSRAKHVHSKLFYITSLGTNVLQSHVSLLGECSQDTPRMWCKSVTKRTSPVNSNVQVSVSVLADTKFSIMVESKFSDATIAGAIQWLSHFTQWFTSTPTYLPHNEAASEANTTIILRALHHTKPLHQCAMIDEDSMRFTLRWRLVSDNPQDQNHVRIAHQLSQSLHNISSTMCYFLLP